MYTKEELESMDITKLVTVASELGIKVSPNDQLENVVYAILDKAAEESAANTTSKRKRTRIVKKDTDKVYTVKGSDGENFDVNGSNGKKAASKAINSEETVDGTPALAPEPAPAPAPKKRGRKSKAELAAIAAAEALKAAQEAQAAEETAQEAQETETAPQESQTGEVAANNAEPQELPATENVMEEGTQDEASSDDNAEQRPTAEMVEMLKNKMEQHNQGNNQGIDAYGRGMDEEGRWLGDPKDGTDFIVVEDIPIEDQEAMPTLDIFDRPMSMRNDNTMPQQAVPAPVE